jgi:hypothetical protein
LLWASMGRKSEAAATAHNHRLSAMGGAAAYQAPVCDQPNTAT